MEDTLFCRRPFVSPRTLQRQEPEFNPNSTDRMERMTTAVIMLLMATGLDDGVQWDGMGLDEG